MTNKMHIDRMQPPTMGHARLVATHSFFPELVQWTAQASFQFSFSHCQHARPVFAHSGGSYISISIDDIDSDSRSLGRFGCGWRAAHSCCLWLGVCVSVSNFRHRRSSIVFHFLFTSCFSVAANSTIDTKRANTKSCSRSWIGEICIRDQIPREHSLSLNHLSLSPPPACHSHRTRKTRQRKEREKI